MSKYTDEFKLSLVERYLAGAKGIQALAEEYGIMHSNLRRWAAIYRVHGIEGLKKRKSAHYSGEFRLSVLKHMWARKLSYEATAVAFNIRNPGSLADWVKLYRSGGVEALQPGRKGRPKSMSARETKPPSTPEDENLTREAMLAELNHLRMENAYLKKVKALVQSKQAPTKRK
jgi:transposase